jgi:hypothetical protein
MSDLPAREDGLRMCRDCGEIKPLTDFHVSPRRKSGRGSYCGAAKPLADFPRNKSGRGGFGAYCKPCHNARGKASIEKRGGSRHYHLTRRYGIGEAEVEELLAEQGGVCAICGADNPEHVDHDHETGHIRGLLCFNCNGGLGQFRDNVDYLTSAITYLKGSTWQRVLVHPGVYRLFSPRRGRRPSRSF